MLCATTPKCADKSAHSKRHTPRRIIAPGRWCDDDDALATKYTGVHVGCCSLREQVRRRRPQRRSENIIIEQVKYNRRRDCAASRCEWARRADLVVASASSIHSHFLRNAHPCGVICIYICYICLACVYAPNQVFWRENICGANKCIYVFAQLPEQHVSIYYT